jgi:hypothetical protein
MSNQEDAKIAELLELLHAVADAVNEDRDPDDSQQSQCAEQVGLQGALCFSGWIGMGSRSRLCHGDRDSRGRLGGCPADASLRADGWSWNAGIFLRLDLGLLRDA